VRFWDQQHVTIMWNWGDEVTVINHPQELGMFSNKYEFPKC